jgi:hypothetical protein
MKVHIMALQCSEDRNFGGKSFHFQEQRWNASTRIQAAY